MRMKEMQSMLESNTFAWYIELFVPGSEYNIDCLFVRDIVRYK